MAKLPTAESLGGMGGVASRRPIASYDTDAITRAGERMGDTIARAGAAVGDAMARAGSATERGMQSLGQGTQQAAAGIRAYEIGVQNFELDRAKAEKLVKQAELDNEFAEDRDYPTMRERYTKRLADINAGIEKTFTSPEVTERFRIWNQPRDIYSDGAVRAKARKMEGDVLTADVQDKLEKLRTTGLSNPDPTKRIDVIETGNGMISGLRDAGHISATQAQSFKQKWVSDYARASVEMMPDNEQVKLLRGQPAEGSPTSFIPPDDRVKLARAAQSRMETAANKASAIRSEEFERAIIDGSAGVSTLPDRKAIEEDPLLTAPRKNTLLRQLDSARGDVAVLQGVATKYADPNGGAFNPFDKKEVDAVDKIWKFEGADMAATQKVVDRTGILPPTLAVKMRGDLASNDPARVSGALQLASNLQRSNPNVFASTTGKKAFEDAVEAFQHNVNDFGMTAEQAARRYIDEQSPEYQTRIKAKIKGEDLNEIVKKNLTPGDVTGAFDTSWWPGSPKLAFEPETRRSMFGDYEEKFREAYLKNGDISRSKAIAADLLRKAWGVTKVNGSEVLMRFPPEKSPVFAGVENAADLVADQAIADIRAETGQAVDREGLRLDPVPGGRTAQAFARGEPPPYIVSWQDKSGVVHMLNPGRVFVADPAAMKLRQADRRRQGLDRERAVNDLREIERSVAMPGLP